MPRRSRMFGIIFSWLCLLTSISTGLVRLSTPLMGWTTFKAFGRNYKHDDMLTAVYVLEKSGLLDAGYNMISLGGGWMIVDYQNSWIPRPNYMFPTKFSGKHGPPPLAGNGTPGCMIPDPVKFPNGVRSFRDMLKSKGFNFGLYTSGEITSCVRF